MIADIKLLPLPEPNGSYTNPYDGDDLENYARACVAHATAAKDAEIEALRAEVKEWKRVASEQAELHGEAEARAERLEEGRVAIDLLRDHELENDNG